MKKHTPMLVIEDDPDGPLLIRSICLDCTVVVSEHFVDARIPGVENMGTAHALEDTAAWFKHTQEQKE